MTEVVCARAVVHNTLVSHSFVEHNSFRVDGFDHIIYPKFVKGTHNCDNVPLSVGKFHVRNLKYDSRGRQGNVSCEDSSCSYRLNSSPRFYEVLNVHIISQQCLVRKEGNTS
jgi:hypothetical protein